MLTLLPVLATSVLLLMSVVDAQLAEAYPVGAPAHAVPGQIQAEDYDMGGEGVGYHDLSAGNSGTAYRSDDVDIKVVADGSTVVGWFQSGEWLAYALDVTADGSYDVRLRTGSAYTPTRTLIVAIDGTTVGQVEAPNIADWDSPLGLVTLRNVALTAGSHQLRVTAGALDWVDLDWIDIEPAAAGPTQVAAAVDTSCATPLQTLVDAAPAGTTLDVPACTYRETVRIAKPLTLDGHGQAEIRGSDVWTNWNRRGNYWAQGPVPALPADNDPTHCQANTANRVCTLSRCSSTARRSPGPCQIQSPANLRSTAHGTS